LFSYTGTLVIVVDEVSMLVWKLLGEVDLFFKELTGNATVPFGGIILVLAGDFYQ